jgi:hypothetical protein
VGQISPQRKDGQIVGYSVYLGVDGDGRRQRRFFRELKDGEEFISKRNQTPLPIGELWDRRSEILYNLDRLRPLRTNLTEVVSFYLENHGSVIGQRLLCEVFDEFLREKLMVGRSQQYDRVMRRCFHQFIEHLGKDRRVGEINRKEITDCNTWNCTCRGGSLRQL